MFRLGDKVKRVKGNFNGMGVGDTAVVTQVSIEGIRLDGYKGECDGWHDNGAFKLIKGDEMMACKRINKYTFGVATDLMIDFDEIEEYLTYAEPLAMVELNGEYWGVISRKIYDKADRCKGGGKLLKRLLTYGNGDNHFRLALNKFPKLIALLKEIKAADFREADRNSGTVTVTLPNI